MHIYFSGIGGVGLGPLAEIARDSGHAISGSDLTATPTFSKLQSEGYELNLDQSGEHMAQVHKLKPIDWFVYTAALPSDHPELAYARRQQIKISKRDELLKVIIDSSGQKLVAVAGTHGKTTTTAMVVWLFKQLGLPVSYSVGALLSWAPSGAYNKTSDYFIYECDEFDRNFLQFHPYLSLITSQGFDHGDTYKDEQAYDQAFEQFKSQSKDVITWQDTKRGLIKLSGEHNRRNGALAISATARLTNQPVSKLAQLIQTFPGASRRFEKLAENIYSDYAHHPVEIAATLELALEFSDDIIAVYQPHQNTRQHHLHYGDCFKDARKIYWLPTYLSREDPNLPVLTPRELTKKLSHHDIILADLDDTLRRQILADKQAGKLVVLMGAGSIDGWARQHLL